MQINKRQLSVRFTRQCGFTLIEILVVVAIIGVLAAIAVPSYRNSIIASNRSVAQAALLDLANRQEQFFLDNRTYTSDLTDLGYPQNMVSSGWWRERLAFSSNHGLVNIDSRERVYVVQIAFANDTRFTIWASPQLAQAEDEECGSLSLNNFGEKGESGTASVSDCW